MFCRINNYTLSQLQSPKCTGNVPYCAMRCENCGEVLKESKTLDKKENKIDAEILVCGNCGQESKIITI